MNYRTHGEERTTSRQRRSTFSSKTASYLGMATIAAEATAARCENTTPTDMTGASITIFDFILYIFALYGIIRLMFDIHYMATARRRDIHDTKRLDHQPSLRERFYRQVYVAKGSNEVFHESPDCQKNLKELRVCLLCYRRDIRMNVDGNNRNDESTTSTTPKTRRDAGK
jgi:hypothetical protein